MLYCITGDQAVQSLALGGHCRPETGQHRAWAVQALYVSQHAIKMDQIQPQPVVKMTTQKSLLTVGRH